MENKKQSSIEYLEHFFNLHCNPSVCDIEYSDYKIAFEEAKKMYNKEMAETYKAGYDDFMDYLWSETEDGELISTEEAFKDLESE
jgi:hypothetical protein